PCSGLIFEGLRPETLAECILPIKARVSQTLKDQATAQPAYRYRLEGRSHPRTSKNPGPDLALTEIFCLVKLPHSRETIDGLVLSRQGGLDINPPRRTNVKIFAYEDG
ncbi:MAG: hypothetical protein PVG99_11470, partial [Desulfobacteraceae bacterium]